MKIEKKSSIAYKLLFYVLFGNIFVSLLFMLQNYIELSKENTKEINRKIEEIKESIIPTLSANLYDEDDDGYKLVLKGILSDENIIRVSFFDSDDLNNPDGPHSEMVYQEIKNFKKESPKSFFIKTMKIYHPDADGNKAYLGKLKVYFTKKYIQEKTMKQTWKINAKTRSKSRSSENGIAGPFFGAFWMLFGTKMPPTRGQKHNEQNIENQTPKGLKNDLSGRKFCSFCLRF